ncbi:Crp/Fnr family transcriptional regulator [Emticicia sp. BO119]|uniref:Crp/Fnr family transcriptional regulator n=1 Tax=Emticicia sp. BO119 TaxID=2757768 RepID=UPI0015F0BB0E|nr:Crp/Fnr family transcriptional regulator [Emticicia sp. BO119]MBA4850629.1 Crp/Fnr family transcriptional regulator [Emticicia sp. BO119]
MKPSIKLLQEKFTGIFEFELLQELSEVGNYTTIDEGHILMQVGGYIRSVPIILQGSIKILRPDNEGREALLYYLGGMDSCAMSLTCCLGQKRSEIMAVAEEKTTLISVPVEKVEEWMTKYNSWKYFVFMTYQKRFEDLLNTIDQIAFHKLDDRLLMLLKKKAKACDCKVLVTTHEELANELATSREVVSRLLKQLEKMNKVRLSRNKIDLL